MLFISSAKVISFTFWVFLALPTLLCRPHSPQLSNVVFPRRLFCFFLVIPWKMCWGVLAIVSNWFHKGITFMTMVLQTDGCLPFHNRCQRPFRTWLNLCRRPWSMPLRLKKMCHLRTCSTLKRFVRLSCVGPSQIDWLTGSKCHHCFNCYDLQVSIWFATAIQQNLDMMKSTGTCDNSLYQTFHYIRSCRNLGGYLKNFKVVFYIVDFVMAEFVMSRCDCLNRIS